MQKKPLLLIKARVRVEEQPRKTSESNPLMSFSCD